MSDNKNKSVDQQSRDMREAVKINEKARGRTKSEESDIEQTRIENRRDADLDDKSPAGDAGPEDIDTREIKNDGSANY